MKNLITFFSKISLLVLLLTAGIAHAGEALGGRFVTNVGCHSEDGTCYVFLSGASFGSTLGCPAGAGRHFRFDNANTENGRRTHASFMAAMLAGKTVDVYVHGCNVNGIPKLSYFTVNN